VCSTRNGRLVSSLGAAHLIDDTQEDFAHNNQTYDVTLDAVNARTFQELQRVLTPSGQHLVRMASPETALPLLWTPLLSRQKARMGISQATSATL